MSEVRQLEQNNGIGQEQLAYKIVDVGVSLINYAKKIKEKEIKKESKNTNSDNVRIRVKNAREREIW